MLKVNGATLQMEVDTGAARSNMSETAYHSLWPDGQVPMLQSSDIQLWTYTGEAIEVLGAIDVDVHYNEQGEHLRLHIV